MSWWRPKPREGIKLLFSADPRALGLFRIYLGVISLIDLWRRIPLITLLYTHDSLSPNADSAQRAAARLDVLAAFATEAEVTGFFVVTTICLILFTVGYRTRLFHILCAVAIISLHNRNTLPANGGDYVLNGWWVWSLFMPLGRGLSLDALLDRLRRRREKSPAALRSVPPADRSPVWTLGILGVCLQIAFIYFYNGVQKDTAVWKDGSAMGWILQQDRVLKPMGAWIRDVLPYEVTTWMSYGTLIVEVGAAILILLPVWTLWSRRVALLSLVGLHLGIYLTMDVGLFSWQSMCGYVVLLTAADFDLMKKVLRRLAGEPVVAHYDSDCGVCHLTARIGARLDGLGRITWYGREDEAPLPPGMADFDAVREGTLVVHAPGSGKVWTHNRAIYRIVAALPLGRTVAWVLLLPGMKAAYDAFAGRRHRVSAWMGMGECGLTPPGEGVEIEEPTPARRALRLAGYIPLQVLCAFWIYASTAQAMVQNYWSRNRLDGYEAPEWTRQAYHYAGTSQTWQLFRMPVADDDGWLIIDALLADGRRIDPQTGEPPRMTLADYRYVSDSALWMTVTSRIADKRKRRAHQALGRWLMRTGTHRLKLRPEDEVVSFDMWWIGDRSPDPRKKGAAPVEKERRLVTRQEAPRKQVADRK